MTDRLLVTGFTAFGEFAVNPSALLGERCGRRFELIEVAYAAADAFLERVRNDDSFDRLLMLGVSARRRRLAIERCARNEIDAAPDVRGEARGPGPIDPTGPATLATTLLADHAARSECFSDDAGCYLCNYLLYRALRVLSPQVRVGFIHVPPLEVMPLEAQQIELARLFDAINAGA